MKEIILKETGILHVEGKARNRNSKPVVCVTTGERFPSCTDAAEMENVNIWSISNCCRGKQKFVKVNGEKRIYKFAKEEPENCVDALAETLQDKLKLLDKYSEVIAELEAEERRKQEEAEAEQKRLEEQERERQRILEEQRKAAARRQRHMASLQRKCNCAKERYDKAQKRASNAWSEYAQAKSELRAYENSYKC